MSLKMKIAATMGLVLAMMAGLLTQSYVVAKAASSSYGAANWLLLTGGAAMAVVAAIGAYLFFAVTGPLRRCIDMSKSIAAGKFDNRVDPRGGKEFAELFQVLNAMQHDLVRHIEEEL